MNQDDERTKTGAVDGKERKKWRREGKCLESGGNTQDEDEHRTDNIQVDTRESTF